MLKRCDKMTLLFGEMMSADFYDEEENYLGYISSINKQTINFIKENGFESEGKIYTVTSTKYNLDKQRITFRCVLETKEQQIK